jgi:hypothetical protein
MKIFDIYEALLEVKEIIKMKYIILLLDTAVKLNLMLLNKFERGEIDNIETFIET